MPDKTIMTQQDFISKNNISKNITELESNIVELEKRTRELTWKREALQELIGATS